MWVFLLFCVCHRLCTSFAASVQYTYVHNGHHGAANDLDTKSKTRQIKWLGIQGQTNSMQQACVAFLPDHRGAWKANSLPQSPNFNGSTWIGKQDVSHFVSRWITISAVCCKLSPGHANQATRWLTRSLSKPGCPTDCGLGLSALSYHRH